MNCKIRHIWTNNHYWYKINMFWTALFAWSSNASLLQSSNVMGGEGGELGTNPLPPLRWQLGSRVRFYFWVNDAVQTKLFCASSVFSSMCRELYTLSRRLSINTCVSLIIRKLLWTFFFSLLLELAIQSPFTFLSCHHPTWILWRERGTQLKM